METEVKTWKEMSSRERDRLVAGKLFGWQERPCDLDESGGELTIYSSGDACCPRCGAYGHINDLEHGTLQPAHYTTNLDTAWTIAELERFSNVELTRYWGDVHFRHLAYRYGCRIIKDGVTFHSFGQTPQGAICLAALSAVGYEIEKEVPSGTNKES